ncbi:hypothetical protein ABHI18_011101 [Aspergillus niger]
MLTHSLSAAIHAVGVLEARRPRPHGSDCSPEPSARSDIFTFY